MLQNQRTVAAAVVAADVDAQITMMEQILPLRQHQTADHVIYEHFLRTPMFNLEATTVLAVIHDGKAAIGGDGQATLGNTVMKSTVRKVRKLHNNTIMAGFAGSTADAFTLFERFEEKLGQFNGNLQRAAVELAKDWRGDRYLRRLEIGRASCRERVSHGV